MAESHRNIFNEYQRRRDHGELACRVQVYEDGYTIFETKDKKIEGVTSAMQDMFLALMFLIIGATKR